LINFLKASKSSKNSLKAEEKKDLLLKKVPEKYFLLFSKNKRLV